ncbi:MAG: hypothetical protein L3J78_03620, partial [Thermoplasmata archaeon]|nr:hypothetical protein [Thermoplasmata archaeon]
TMKKKDKSWWRLRQIRHRDAVILSVLSSSCLLAGEVIDSNITTAYRDYIAPYLNNPPILVILVALTILGFTTYFGGIFVLLGGLHFSWGRVTRGRFLTGLGLGVSLLGLLSRLAQRILATGKPFGDPVVAFLAVTTGLSGLGILFGLGSHTLMGQYALMLKKHAKRVWRRWRKTRRPARKSSRS